MALILPPLSMLPQQLLSRACLISAGRLTFPCKFNARVSLNHNANSFASLQAQNGCATPFPRIHIQSYATTPGKPKAHTGRKAASRRKPATKKTTTVDPDAETTTAAGSAKAKKPASKRATKAKTGKATSKPKAEPKIAQKPKRELTEKTIARLEKAARAQERRELRAKALLNEAPKRLPGNPYLVFSNENRDKSLAFAESSKALSAKYKDIDLSEKEHLNHIANENRAKNAIAYKQWLSSFPPRRINEANIARIKLRGEARKEGKQKLYHKIQDDRLVKHPITAYAWFLQERVASGDLRNMKISEIGVLVGREWRELSPNEKQKYEDLSKKDTNRYHEELKTVYGVDSDKTTSQGKSATT